MNYLSTPMEASLKSTSSQRRTCYIKNSFSWYHVVTLGYRGREHFHHQNSLTSPPGKIKFNIILGIYHSYEVTWNDVVSFLYFIRVNHE